ncbi:MFS transporter [Actinomadura sp. K4S16]|uniref:MFS transporter n=1 Tax=Actinomadura sp. K4S16 TaxID=1316147 RepID=UPI00190F97EB
MHTSRRRAVVFAIPSTLALLVTSFPSPVERTRAIAIYSAVIGAGASVGVIVGGLLIEYLSWRWGAAAQHPSLLWPVGRGTSRIRCSHSTDARRLARPEHLIHHPPTS